MANKEYYEILGVSESASDREIKQKYRELAKRYHPDANRGNKAAEEKFKDISEAYSVLSDPKKRQQYDQMRKLGAFGGTGTGGFNFEGFDFSDFMGSRSGKRREGGDFSFEDIFGVGGFGDIFSNIFDKGSRIRQEKYGPQQGADIEVELQIPFELSVTGGKKTFSINKNEACPVCNGTGSRPGSKPKTCPECHGRGTISISQGIYAVNRTCPRCYGRGYLVDNPCSNCGGTGQSQRSKKFTVKIAPGIDSGTRMKLSGQGNPGVAGGPAGDLILILRVGSDGYFRREGNDVYCNATINIVQAALGTKIKVRTIDNKHLELKIPPGTQSGRKFRLRGMGIKTKSGRGEQFIVIEVLTPTYLNDKQKQLLKEFAKAGELEF